MSMLSDAQHAGRRTLALALAAWLLGGGVLGLVGLCAEAASRPEVWREAFTLSLEERMTRTLDQDDRTGGRPPGRTSGLVRALNAEVPPHETIQLVGLRERRQARDLVAVAHLCFPRRFGTDLVPLPERWEPGVQGYLLAFGPELRARIEARKTLLASGPDWTLWH